MRARKTASLPPTRLLPADAELLTTREAAALTKMSMAWFERHRWERTGPSYIRRGRSVRYVKAELLEWWAEGRER
ncbi:helix-turn-helix domain-containing protein [Luteimonas colneyensis]